MVAFACALVAANAGFLPSPAVSQTVVSRTINGGYDHHPQYSFSYYVNDPQTGDIKDHQEVRNGDKVSGSYSLVEPDGSRRTVSYEADGENGFNAAVGRQSPVLGPIASIIAKAAGAPSAVSSSYSSQVVHGYSQPAPIIAKVVAPIRAAVAPVVAKIAAVAAPAPVVVVEKKRAFRLRDFIITPRKIVNWLLGRNTKTINNL